MNNLNISIPINSTGYGITSFNIAKKLHSKDVSLSLFPMGGSVTVTTDEEQSLVRLWLKNSEAFDYNAPCLKIWHQYDLAAKIGNKEYAVFPFFEVDKISPKEQHHLNYADMIFVASEWGKQVLLDNGITKPIIIAPLGVDMDIFTDTKSIKLSKSKYIFFHIGKWEHRKSQDFLFKAFDNAFTENDGVELWLLPFNPFLNEEETQYWFDLANSCKLANKIHIFDRLPSQYHLADFINRADCGVFLSRAEGWNNEIIESMAMNKPVIVTNYSAHTQYCNENNSYLVNIEETEPAIDNKWFNGEGNWAKLGSSQLDQAIHYMKYVYSNHIQDNPEGVITAKNHSWNNTANIIYQSIFKN
jgi:glycosyltransferase involved in cell wall biosynthesis